VIGLPRGVGDQDIGQPVFGDFQVMVARVLKPVRAVFVQRLHEVERVVGFAHRCGPLSCEPQDVTQNGHPVAVNLLCSSAASSWGPETNTRWIASS